MKHTPLILSLLVLVGCSSANDGSEFSHGAGGQGQGGTGVGGQDPSTGGSPATGGSMILGGSAGQSSGCSQGAQDADGDGDGFTIGDGDCNDCSPQVNPGAYDFPGNGVDEDCNGTADDEPTGCDQGLAIEGYDPLDAAKALGLCKFPGDGNRSWGVLSAKWVYADGSTASMAPVPDYEAGDCQGGGQGTAPNANSFGLLPGFGSNLKPRDGASMVALSSGVARSGQNGFSPEHAQMCTRSAMPDGFPAPSPTCNGKPIDTTPIANDAVGLELVIRAPTNAKSLHFDFDFYTYEYPDYICSDYNDSFVALLFSSNPSVPQNHNISFDAQSNPVTVNNGFLEVCQPGYHGGKNFACAMGTAELAATGFEPSAATGWLQTSSAINPGEEFTIRFAVWDAGDEVLDSTALIDNFRFEVEEGENTTVRPPPPK